MRYSRIVQCIKFNPLSSPVSFRDTRQPTALTVASLVSDASPTHPSVGGQVDSEERNEKFEQLNSNSNNNCGTFKDKICEPEIEFFDRPLLNDLPR